MAHTTKHQRRQSMLAVREALGTERFADFIVDVLAQNGPGVSFQDLGIVAQHWASVRPASVTGTQILNKGMNR